MKYRVGLLTILIAGACLNAVAFEQTISLVDGTLSSEVIQSKPTRNIEKVDDGYIVTYHIETAGLSEIPNDTSGVRWSIPSFNANYVAGEPATLFRNDMFVVPEGQLCEVKLLDASYIDIPCVLTCTTPIGSRIGTAQDSSVDSIKEFDGYFPKEILCKIDGGKFRQQTIVYAHVSPVQYNFKERMVRAYNSISYKVKIYDDPTWKPKDIISRTNSCANIIPKGMEIKDSLFYENIAEPVNVTKDYLIITTTNLLSEATKFAEWKKTMGFRTHIVHKRKGEWVDFDEVYDVVTDYRRDYPELNYVMIIGKHEDVPSEESTGQLDLQEYKYKYLTDYELSYANPGHSDLPPLYVGRIPVTIPFEAYDIISKIIRYEKSPTTDTKFYQQATHCVQFEARRVNSFGPIIIPHEADSRDLMTSEEIKAHMRDHYQISAARVYTAKDTIVPKRYCSKYCVGSSDLPYDLLAPRFNWYRATAQDIIDKINKGSLYTLGLTHGTVNTWCGFDFTSDSVPKLTSNYKPTLVFSMGCHTGNTSNPLSRSIAEALLAKSYGGAIAVYAPTDNSISGLNDALLIGMFNAIWQTPELNFYTPEDDVTVGVVTPFTEPSYELGEILIRGRLRIDETYMLEHATTEQNYNKQIFQLYGDPSMQFTTQKPTEFERVSVQRYDDYIVVMIENDRAKISFYDRNSGVVESFYGAKAMFKSAHPENVVVCISDHNRIPLINEAEDDTVKEEVYDREYVYMQGKNYTYSDTDPAVISARNIKIGSNVNPADNPGPVTITGGSVTLKCEKLTIEPDFTINPKSNIKITK